MRLIKPSWEIWEQEPGIQGIYKAIERAGRTCYRSEDKITEDSAKPFVDRMIASGHGAMLEHGTVYLQIHWDDSIREEFDHIYCDYASNPYSKIIRKVQEDDLCPTLYVTTNYRVLVENGWLDDLEYLCEPTEYHDKRVTVHFVSDIHFYKDITRHRPMSYAIESTRFCNYIKERFGGSISFATPIWLKEEEELEFEEDLKVVESLYFKWLKKGWQPQQAAYFLIQGTKADIVMTGFISDFMHVFDLRTSKATTGKAHPSVIELFDPLYEEFVKRGLINESN